MELSVVYGTETFGLHLPFCLLFNRTTLLARETMPLTFHTPPDVTKRNASARHLAPLSSVSPVAS